MSALPDHVTAALSWSGPDDVHPAPYARTPLPWDTIPAPEYAAFATRDQAVEHAAGLRATRVRWLALYEKFAAVEDGGNIVSYNWLLTAVESVSADEVAEAVR